MKKTKLIGIALVAVLIAAVGFYSCEKTYVEPVTPTEITDGSKLVIAPAVWRVTSFQWKDRENNGHFISYTFQFNPEGTIEAVHNHVKEYGKWSLKNNNILQINFEADILLELNNNWTIKDHTSTSMNLRGLSPYDDSSEYLLLEKSSSLPPTETEAAQ